MLEPLAERYHGENLALGRALPIADRLSSVELDTIVLGIVRMLDGEALMASLLPHPEQEDVRVEQLVRILSGQPLFSRPSAAFRYPNGAMWSDTPSQNVQTAPLAGPGVGEGIG